VIADLVIQVQKLQDEVHLRGAWRSRNASENAKKRQRDQYLDLDQRISEKSGAGPASPDQPAPQTDQQAEPQPQDDVVEAPPRMFPRSAPSMSFRHGCPVRAGSSKAQPWAENKPMIAHSSLSGPGTPTQRYQSFLSSYRQAVCRQCNVGWRVLLCTRNFDLA
jgi:hypothetical protein